MDKDTYVKIEAYMQASMKDSAHDTEHVYRVLYLALDIAAHERGVDHDVLVPACLLHDIGREAQHQNPKLCHAEEGARMAHAFLTGIGYPAAKTGAIANCIRTHRFRGIRTPQTIEAQILFDADKLDVTGAVGIIRSVQYRTHEGGALYHTHPDGTIMQGLEPENKGTLFHEYRYKTEKIYNGFTTARARELAAERRQSGEALLQTLYHEFSQGRAEGKQYLNKLIE